MSVVKNIQDNKVYTVTKLREVLKEHNLPSTLWWIRKAEKQGLIPRTEIGSYQRKYSGKQIKNIINSLLKKVTK